uniref:RING-type E3 ubiquitin transferase n=2 Tax=Nicotiana TaxID=4085 RepID=A0A1S4A3X4_TOBAC|nr:PREDICTED: E3 ubiquitin-protein ligase Praja-2-like [Nicotiana sylvestris]XP_016471271.1 PREDICTED: E3 ubiquitin-protein ligase Praja-2-like [Nicotiana tabacum]
MSTLQTHRSSQLPHNHTRHSSPNYYGNHQQQRGYRRNVQRRPYYQSSRQHQRVHNPSTNYPSFGVGSYPTVIDEVFAQQYWNHTSAFQPSPPYYSVDMVLLPTVVVDNHGQYGLIWRYCRVPNYELIDDSYVTNDPRELIDISTGMLDHLIGQQANSAFDFGFLYDHLFDREDDVDGHDEEKENDDAVLKHLKIRTHHSLAKDGVVSDVEPETCAICQSEYEDEESIGKLQCGHEYHTDCIKQWLWRKKDCPMCRASVLPSQEQRL